MHGYPDVEDAIRIRINHQVDEPSGEERRALTRLRLMAALVGRVRKWPLVRQIIDLAAGYNRVFMVSASTAPADVAQPAPQANRSPNSFSDTVPNCRERDFFAVMSVDRCEGTSPYEGTHMRMAALSLIGAVCLAASAVAANAAPAVPSPVSQPESNIVQAAGGCGWGLHPNRWGHCVPNRYGYYRPRPVWRGYYGGGYYGPRGWGSPSDHVADQLNAQQRGRFRY